MSNEVADLKALNYYLFGFLIPSGLMFSRDYWKWRLTKPQETEIYRKHLNFILNELRIPNDILEISNEKERYQLLLKARIVDEQLYEDLCGNKKPAKVDFDAAISKFSLHTNNGKKDYWRLNEVRSDYNISKIEIKNDGISSIDFYPLDDVAGGCMLESVMINNKAVSLDSLAGYKPGFKYLPKVTGCYSIPINDNSDKIEVTCIWKYKTTKDFLNSIE